MTAVVRGGWLVSAIVRGRVVSRGGVVGVREGGDTVVTWPAALILILWGGVGVGVWGSSSWVNVNKYKENTQMLCCSYFQISAISQKTEVLVNKTRRNLETPRNNRCPITRYTSITYTSPRQGTSRGWLPWTSQSIQWGVLCDG